MSKEGKGKSCSKKYSETIGTCQVSTLQDSKTSKAESITEPNLMLVNQLLSRKQPTNKSEKIQTYYIQDEDCNFVFRIAADPGGEFHSEQSSRQKKTQQHCQC